MSHVVPHPSEQPSIVPHARSFKLLVVEDNQGDVRLVREALSKLDDSIQLSVAEDGRKALNMLLHETGRRPDLILLDLNLPAMDGRSLLSRIKSDLKLRRIPVVVLTSSDAPRDVKHAYDLHANCYIVKPPRLEDFVALIRRSIEYWTEVIRLPGRW